MNATASPGHSRRLGRLAAAIAGLAVFAVCVKYVSDKRQDIGATPPGEITGSVAPTSLQLGPSGLPLPRFVSLKSDKVNVRKGPSSDHNVAWVFHRKGMPVEIIAEFENWRKIRDSEGAEGWILQQMLSGKRSAIVMDYGHKAGAPLRPQPGESSVSVAMLSPGVTGMVQSCDGQWCVLETQGLQGYVSQTRIWGVYPGEQFD